MKKGQREYVSQHLRDLIAHDEHEGEDSDLPAFRAALALLTDEAELQRSVGEAVITHLPRHVRGDDYEKPSSIVDESGSGFVVQYPRGWVGPMLRAIASALRGGGR